MKLVCRGLVIALFGVGGFVQVACSEREEDIDVSKVPEKIMAAALKAVPGIEIDEAEVEKTRRGLVYELEGEVDGKEFELHITADGIVLDIEGEDNDDDEKGKSGKDDDDDGDDEKK